MITEKQIAEWESERGNGMNSAVGEYTPTEFWTLLDAYKRHTAELSTLRAERDGMAEALRRIELACSAAVVNKGWVAYQARKALAPRGPEGGGL